MEKKYILVFLIAGFFNIDTVFAGTDIIKLGNFEIHPSLTAKESYNSNIFSENDEDGEKPDHDWFSTVIPGIDIMYPGERLKIDLGYSADIERYNRFADENTEKHDAKAKVNITSPSKNYIFTFENNYKNTKDPLGDDEQSNDDLKRADRIQNILKGSVEIKFGELARLILDASNDYGKYDLSALKVENKTSTTFGGSFYYKFWPKTSVTVNYHFGTIFYRDATLAENSDSNNHSVRAGILIDPGGKLSGNASFGYKVKDFTDGVFKDNDANTYSTDVKLNWKPWDITKFNLAASRSIEESSFGEGSFFIQSSVNLGLTQNISDKITGKLDGTYTLGDYPNADNRDDDKITVKIDLKYNLRDWLSFNANYEYQNNNSNINSKDYKTHKTFLLLQTTF